MSTAIDDLLRAVKIINEAHQKKTVICQNREVAMQATEVIQQYRLEDLFTVQVNVYCPRDKIFIIPTPPEEGDEDMGLVKHGEGSVLPENEGQKTAQQEGGLSVEAAQELARENEEADGAVDSGTTD